MGCGEGRGNWEKHPPLVSHCSPFTHLWLLWTSLLGQRLLHKATLEQCQQKQLAPVHCILGSSSARPWKLHVGLISWGVGGRVRREADGSHVICHQQRQHV